MWGIQDRKKCWNFHQSVSNLCSIQEKIIGVQFSSSECKVQVFANCSKNQNKFLIASSSPALPNTEDFARNKSPRGGQIQVLWNAQSAKSPHQPGVPPLGQADDKCIIMSLQWLGCRRSILERSMHDTNFQQIWFHVISGALSKERGELSGGYHSANTILML